MDHNKPKLAEIYLRKREISTMRGLFLGGLFNYWSYAVTYALLYWAHFSFPFRFPEDVSKDILFQALRWGVIAGAIIGGTMGAKSDLDKPTGRFTDLLFRISFFVGAMTAITRHLDLLKALSMWGNVITLLILLFTFSLASFVIKLFSPLIEKWHPFKRAE